MPFFLNLPVAFPFSPLSLMIALFILSTRATSKSERNLIEGSERGDITRSNIARVTKRPHYTHYKAVTQKLHEEKTSLEQSGHFASHIGPSHRVSCAAIPPSPTFWFVPSDEEGEHKKIIGREGEPVRSSGAPTVSEFATLFLYLVRTA